MSLKNITISQFNYNLPTERIAKYPLEKRDSSKLLTYKKGEISQLPFSKLPSQLSQGSLLVFNTTKVIRARLNFIKPTGASIEVFCLEPHAPQDYALALQANHNCQWKCLVGNLKRWKEPELIKEIHYSGEVCTLSASIIEKTEDAFIINFNWDKNLSFSEILELSGAIPIPPYLNRDSEAIDTQRYQTVFSKHEGSVAAPTAGLHFTPKLLTDLEEIGINKADLTLHVGAGTFKPVKSEILGQHHMHTEIFSFDLDLLENLSSHNEIIAVGTTAVRSLESIYQIGIKLLSKTNNPLHIRQWEAYELPKYSKKESIAAVKNYMLDNAQKQLTAKTDILIGPGYDFGIISGMITNFHQPQSTLLLLVSALVGESWKTIYDYALNNQFRFLSYGDSSLLFKA